MPGPPVATILTSNDPGLGTNEMKVKGTYVLSGENKAITSRYLFISEEEEQNFIKSNPLYAKPPTYIDLEDGSPQRGVNVPYKMKNQKKDGILDEGEEITPKTKINSKVKPKGPGVEKISKIMAS